MKTTEFEIFSRTKTLETHTNSLNIIYDAAKCLLLNEIKSLLNVHKKQMNLRLLGVRVSGLREINSSKKKAIKTIDNFFSKKPNINENDICNDASELDNLKEYLFGMCPICNEFIEGNSDFLEQHIDFCTWFGF